MPTAPILTSGSRSLLQSCCTALLVGLLLVTVTSLAGCSGCTGTSTAAKKKKLEDEEKKKKKKIEKPKPDFEWTKLKTFPDDPTTVANYVKPGHWISARQRFQTNNFDFAGDIESATVDREDKMLDVERTKFQLTGSRKVQLPKGTPKDTELLYHIPRRILTQSGITKNVWLRTRLLTGHGGREVTLPSKEGTAIMPDYQFYMVVLAKDSDSYGYLKKLESVSAPRNDFEQPTRLYYRVLLPPLDLASDMAVPLSSNSLTWTSVAYVWWDEAQPASLAPDQQQALLDWVHWGGQLVISGPNSLDLLKGSFLSEYLPADKLQSREYQLPDLQELDENWSVFCARTKDPRKLDLVGQSLLGAELKKHPDAQFLPGTGNLILERRVGQGRIVVSAIPLNDRRVVYWKSYDNFVNACLLRRPSRKFIPCENNTVVHQTWTDFQDELWLDEDPRLGSTLRYFARDIGYLEQEVERRLFESLSAPQRAEQASQRNGGPAAQEKVEARTGQHPASPDWHFDGYSYSPESGVAGWNDFSAIADASRKALTRAAGIKIPQPDFVLRVVGLYLLVLVPLNWLVFRLLGRVEWAWIAAPIIAIVGAIMVVRTAQLDIGFIRSRTEISLLELQGGFPRGHLTRFTALYTSLATAYDFGFEDPSALALPFSVDPTYRRELHESPISVHFRNETKITGEQRLAGELSGFQVGSNSTGMVHSEQMVPLGGALRLDGNTEDGFQLRNESDLALRGVGILRMQESGLREIAWMGDLSAHTSVTLKFRPQPKEWEYFAEWEQSPTTIHSDGDLDGEINLTGLIDLAMRKLRLRPGDTRLIGWTDTDVPGIRFQPTAAQTTFRAMVICHLTRGALPPPKPDVNCSTEFKDPVVDLPDEIGTREEVLGQDPKDPKDPK